MIELAILRLLWKWKRQGMDEEKATKDKKSPKNTLLSFQRFAFNGSLKYSLKLRKQLFQSTLHISDGKQFFFENIKSVF